MIQVAVCSPIPALRAGLSALIAGDPGLTVWAAASTLDDLPRPLPAGCVMICDSGGLRGDAPAEDANDDSAGYGDLNLESAALLIITGEPPGDDPEGGLRRWIEAAGPRAWGAVVPDASAEALRAAVRALAEGLSVFSAELLPGAQPVLGRYTARPAAGPQADDSPLERLSERETEVLRRLAEGLTNKQAALALGISEHTVKFHVSSIYSKLGVMNRAEAVREGARKGYIPL